MLIITNQLNIFLNFSENKAIGVAHKTSMPLNLFRHCQVFSMISNINFSCLLLVILLLFIVME